VAGDEVNMSHSKKTAEVTRRASNDETWTSSAGTPEWDTDTDVMPPEYCRQLLEISRQLRQGK
jgi:hypothetical protein